MAWFDTKPAPAEPERVIFHGKEPDVEVKTINFGTLAQERAPRALPESRPAPVAPTTLAEVAGLSDISDVSEASDDSDDIDWQARLEEAREQVRAEMNETFEARLQDALKEQRELQERRWLATLDVLAQWQAERTEEMSHAVLEMSGALTKHIVGREVLDDEEAYLVIVEQAMRRAFEYDELRIHVPESAVPGLEARRANLQKRHPQHTSIKIVGDETLEAGDCAIVSQGVRVEGMLEERVGQLVDAARSALVHEHALTPETMTSHDLSDMIDAVDGRGLADEMLSEPTEVQG